MENRAGNADASGCARKDADSLLLPEASPSVNDEAAGHIGVTVLDWKAGDDDEERSPDLIPECSNDDDEIMTMEAVVRRIRAVPAVSDDYVDAALEEARRGGRGGCWIEPAIVALATRLGVEPDQIWAKEKKTRDFGNDLTTLVMMAVAEIRKEFKHAIIEDNEFVFELGAEGGECAVRTIGMDAAEYVAQMMMGVFGDSKAMWMNFELVQKLIIFALSVPREVIERHAAGPKKAA